MQRRLLLMAIAVIAYGGALRASFHFDDYYVLVNPLITTFPGLWQMWNVPQTRPLTNLTFWLNYQVNGPYPAGFHAINLLLHLIAVLLLYAALSRLLPEPAAFWASVIFAVHPIESEAVTYIFARSTLLSTVFCLGSLLLWARGSRYWAIAMFGLALLSKEECVTYPLLLLLLSIWRKEEPVSYRWPIAIMLALALLAGVRAVWATTQVSGSGAGFSAGVSPLAYLAAEGAAILRYVFLVFIPWGLTVEPTLAISYAFSWAVVLAIIAAALWGFRKHHPFAVWLLAGFILIIPSSSVFPASDLAADRRMYLPMIAFSAAFGSITPYLLPLFRFALTAVLLLLSILRTEAWRTEQSLWREAAELSPTHVRPLLQLSRFVDAREAITLLTRAQTMEPANGKIPAELGRVYLVEGQYALALQQFGRALALSPRDANALSNRGTALLALKQEQAAKQDFEQALKIDPCLAAARHNLQALGETDLPPCPASLK